MLIEAELHTERHADHFPDDAPDVLWLLRCGEEEWVVLAKDKSIRSNEMERQALFNAGVAAFLLTSANTTGEENGIRKVFVLRFPVSLGMMQSLIRNVR